MGGGAPSSLEVWSGCSLPGENRMLWHWVPTKTVSRSWVLQFPLIPLPCPLGWGSWLPVPGSGQHCSQSLSVPWNTVQGCNFGIGLVDL